MVALTTASPQPTRFQTRCNRFTAFLGIVLCLFLGLHYFTGDRLTVRLSEQYNRGRIWRANDPPRSEASFDLERRLNDGLDRYEAKRPGKQSWNKVIWQSWKDDGLLKWRGSWIDLNPDWEYKLLTDAEAEKLVFQVFADIPEVIETWKAYPKNVLRFDLFRYLIPYALGGLYADVDTTCTIPISNWLTEAQWADQSITAAIGLEYDGPRDRYSWNRYIDYVQYVMLAKPLSPIFRTALIETILRSHRLAEYQKVPSIAETTWKFGMVLATTGPRTFSDACLASIMASDPSLKTEEEVWRKSYAIVQPVKLGNAVILPPASWLRGATGIPKYYLHHGQGSWL